MLTYNFKDKKKPLYLQAYEFIKSDILSGNLKSNEKLPSKRTFAENNGVSIITIQNAYDLLLSEGFVYSKPRSGYYVSKIQSLKPTEKHSGIKHPVDLPAKEDIDIDLSSNIINPYSFPFSIWAKLSRQIISNLERELMEVCPGNGTYELRSAISSHLSSFRGMSVSPDQIVIGAGTEYLYSLILQLLGFDKLYSTENPGYDKLSKIYSQYHTKCKYLDMDDNGISINALNHSKASVVHICPNHHFPTGITMPASRRYEILEWASRSNDRFIIEDDYDSEFRTNGKPIPTLFSMDQREKVIYINTFSKSLSPTIRISYMVLPCSLASQYYKKLSFYSCTVSNFEQYTLAAFIKQGYFEKHINRMRLYYSKQREELKEILINSSLQGHFNIIDNESGLHFLIKLDTSLSDKTVYTRLLKNKIKIAPLSQYFQTEDKSSDHYFIINYSNLDMKKMPEVCETIASLLFPSHED